MSHNLSTNYGQALYQLATSQGSAPAQQHLFDDNGQKEVASSKPVDEQILHDLKALAELFSHKGFKKLLEDLSSMPDEVKEKVLEQTFGGKVHPFTVNLLKLLAVKKRLALVPKVYENYSKLYHEAKGIAEVVVRTARTLSKDEEHSIHKKLEEQRKQKVAIRFEEKPALIGGVQIYERGYLTDYSIQHQLADLKKHLLTNS